MSAYVTLQTCTIMADWLNVGGRHLVACASSLFEMFVCRAQRGKKRAAEEWPQQSKDGAQAAAAEDVQGKPKRKYVKSGRFVGKFNDYQKQKQARANKTGKAAGERQNKQAAGRTVEHTAV